MESTDLAGWLAAAFTLATFVCRDMQRLRLMAICANLAFVAYGIGAGLMPVMVLHLLLAPVNTWRLLEMRQRQAEVSGPPTADRLPQAASDPRR